MALALDVFFLARSFLGFGACVLLLVFLAIMGVTAFVVFGVAAFSAFGVFARGFDSVFDLGLDSLAGLVLIPGFGLECDIISGAVFASGLSGDSGLDVGSERGSISLAFPGCEKESRE